MKVLFVTEKWCDGNENCGLTNSAHNFFSTLGKSGLADYSTLHFDEFFQSTSQKIDNYLLEYCVFSKPDLLVFTHLYGSDYNPDTSTFARIKTLGIPIVFIWFDSVYPHIQEVSARLNTYASLNIFLDGKPHIDKSIQLWTPQDPDIYKDLGLERDIDVSFCGSIMGPERTKYCSELNVYVTGGQRTGKLSVIEYANVFQRSKISLNFPKAAFIDQNQTKGRIFEATLCGSMLMELENESIKKWFIPYEDYVPFNSVSDCKEKIVYYLSNENLRKDIAFRANQKVKDHYNHIKFWDTIFKELKLL